ncbi:Hemolysin-type calcium-binding region protein [Actinobacteria bacterium OK074]|nr:Hemolysin-type calcium-binding region protein [Actinobacteria bacterium OK074]
MSALLTRRGLRRAAAAAALSLGIGLALPIATAGSASAASSATAGNNPYNTQFTYTAAAGQANNAVVTESVDSGSTSLTFVVDDVVPITAGAGCTYPDSADTTKVSCTVDTVPDAQDPYDIADFNLGDGNDKVTFKDTSDERYFYPAIHLGAGNDTYNGSGDNGANVYGDAGNDTIAGSAATLSGGDGNDTITATGGDYTWVSGGAGNDVITAGPGFQYLYGDAGNDTIYGAQGNDWIYGGTGNDVLYGNSGNDTVYGNSGNDKLYGGPGTDTLSGGPGTNVVSG